MTVKAMLRHFLNREVIVLHKDRDRECRAIGKIIAITEEYILIKDHKTGKSAMISICNIEKIRDYYGQ